MSRGLPAVALAGCLLAAGAAWAQPVDAPILPGIGSHDPRVAVDADAAPWRAVGKLQAMAGSVRLACTGTLIAPATVLTAAHCLYNRLTRAYFRPESVHFLVGYEHGAFAGEAAATRFRIGPGFDPVRPVPTRGSDWALVSIDAPLGTQDRRLTRRPTPSDAGTPIAIGGYEQDRAHVITADLACHVVGIGTDEGGRRLLRHDCTGTHGVSGAPVLMRDGARWFVIGIAVAAEQGVASGLAATLDAVPEP